MSAEKPRHDPEEDAAIARSEFAAGHPEHAAQHVAWALGADPVQPSWRELFDTIVTASEAPETLLPLQEEGSYYASVAGHAYILARQGKIKEACDLLLQVILVKPDVAYMEWLLEWLRNPLGRNTLDMDRAAWFIGQLVEQLPVLKLEEERHRPTLDRIPAFVETVTETQSPNSFFLFLAASLLRRMGRIDEAMRAAEESDRIEPGYNASVALGMIFKEKGDTVQALLHFRKALEYSLNDVTIRMDIADLMAETGDLEGAERYYGEGAALEPEHDWAVPSLNALRYLRTGDPKDRVQLEGYARSHPDNERARHWVHRFRPYVGGFLPPAAEAIVNVFRQLGQGIEEGKGPPEGALKVTLSSLEAPSAILAANLQLRAWGSAADLQVTVEAIPQPDPRMPRKYGDYLLWKYQGNSPLVSARRPEAVVVSEVQKFAMQPYDYVRWNAAATDLGRQMGPTLIPDLLGAMVYPSLPPQGMRAWDWIQRLQVASALTIAHTDAGWKTSARRKALLSLANGPSDWTVTAALIALTAVSAENREAQVETIALFTEMLNSLPKPGYVCYVHPLVICFQQLPLISASLRAQLEQLQTMLESSD